MKFLIGLIVVIVLIGAIFIVAVHCRKQAAFTDELASRVAEDVVDALQKQAASDENWSLIEGRNVDLIEVDTLFCDSMVHFDVEGFSSGSIFVYMKSRPCAWIQSFPQDKSDFEVCRVQLLGSGANYNIEYSEDNPFDIQNHLPN